MTKNDGKTAGRPRRQRGSVVREILMRLPEIETRVLRGDGHEAIINELITEGVVVSSSAYWCALTRARKRAAAMPPLDPVKEGGRLFAKQDGRFLNPTEEKQLATAKWLDGLTKRLGIKIPEPEVFRARVVEQVGNQLTYEIIDDESDGAAAEPPEREEEPIIPVSSKEQPLTPPVLPLSRADRIRQETQEFVRESQARLDREAVTRFTKTEDKS